MSRLLSRRWIVAHVVIVAAVTTCVMAGRWQLRRLHARRVDNRLQLARREAPPLTDPARIRGGAAYRRASLTGSYDGERQVLLPGRVSEGRTGSAVLTPLRTDAGVAVLIDRGWIPQQIYDPAVPPPLPPPGPVTVVGILVPSDERGAFSPRIPAEGVLRSIVRLDIERIGRQVPYRLAPLALRLERQTPQQAAAQPLTSPLDLPGEGPHLSYAVQWFLFAAVFLVGYGVLARRALTGRPQDESSAGSP